MAHICTSHPQPLVPWPTLLPGAPPSLPYNYLINRSPRSIGFYNMELLYRRCNRKSLCVAVRSGCTVTAVKHQSLTCIEAALLAIMTFAFSVAGNVWQLVLQFEELPSDGNKETIAIGLMNMLVGSGIGCITAFYNGIESLSKTGHRKIEPNLMFTITTNISSALLAIDLGFLGPNYSICATCASSNYCFCAAANHIREVKADLMIAGGVEAGVVPAGIGGFAAYRALKAKDWPFKHLFSSRKVPPHKWLYKLLT
ncbi:3-oxoacyl-[acyl-carrier-protein] synthase 2 [Tanacetum coccineum]